MRLVRSSLIFTFLLSISIASLARTSTPEQYGAKGDGMTDDTQAIAAALKENDKLVLQGTYRVEYLNIPEGRELVGNGTARLLYFAVDIAGNCRVRNVTFDGQWNTRGVQLEGSNIKIEGCGFVNTKGTSRHYGGLTSAVWVGRYQDLDEKQIKYHDILIRNCVFDGCEPMDVESRVSSNTTVARFILSYGCDRLTIEKCEFRNMKGTYDADAIQLRAYTIASDEFPFSCSSTKWTGKRPPYPGHYYANCNVMISGCVFEQGESKSSIKIMCSGAVVENNRFVLLNKNGANPSYSIVRAHVVSGAKIRKNTIVVEGGATNSLFKIGNSKDVVIERNRIISREASGEAVMSDLFEVTYSSDCVIRKNDISVPAVSALLHYEYNDNVLFTRNKVKVTRYDGEGLRVFVQLSNHYSYPPEKETVSIISKNTFEITGWKDGVIETSNKYDFPAVLRDNKFKRNIQ